MNKISYNLKAFVSVLKQRLSEFHFFYHYGFVIFSICIFTLNIQTDNITCRINWLTDTSFCEWYFHNLKWHLSHHLPVPWIILTSDFSIVLHVCLAYVLHIFHWLILFICFRISMTLMLKWPPLHQGSLFSCSVSFDTISRWSRLILYVSRCRKQILNWSFLQEYLIPLHGKKYLEKTIKAHYNFMASDNQLVAVRN